MIRKLCVVLLVMNWCISVSNAYAMRISCALFAARYIEQQKRQRHSVPTQSYQNATIVIQEHKRKLLLSECNFSESGGSNVVREY